jgi:hypothetical protein
MTIYLSNPRDIKIELMAKLMCRLIGVAPTDPMDGSPNWWMFHNDAAKLIDDLDLRFPTSDIIQFGPAYGPYVAP